MPVTRHNCIARCRSLQCLIAIALATQAAARHPNWWDWWLHGQAQLTQSRISAVLHVEAASKESFTATYQDVTLESIVSRALHPAAATIDQIAPAASTDTDTADRFCMLAVYIDILLVQSTMDVKGLISKASHVLNSREFRDQLEVSDIHLSRTWVVPVEPKQYAAGASLLDQVCSSCSVAIWRRLLQACTQALQAVKIMLPVPIKGSLKVSPSSINSGLSAAFYLQNTTTKAVPESQANNGTNDATNAVGYPNSNQTAHLGLALPSDPKMQQEYSLPVDDMTGADYYTPDPELNMDYSYLEFEHDQKLSAKMQQGIEKFLLPPMLDLQPVLVQQAIPADPRTEVQQSDNGQRQLDSVLDPPMTLTADIILQESVSQPFATIMSDMASSIWQAIKQAQQVSAAAMQQYSVPSGPFAMQGRLTSGAQGTGIPKIVSNGFSSNALIATVPADLPVQVNSAVPSSTSDSNTVISQASLEGNPSDGAELEFSVTVESTTVPAMLPFLHERAAVAQEAVNGKHAGMVAKAVLEAALGLTQQDGINDPQAEQQIEAVLQRLEASGLFTNSEQSMPSATAAAAATAGATAAAGALQKEPWNFMEMHIEITGTTGQAAMSSAKLVTLSKQNSSGFAR